MFEKIEIFDKRYSELNRRLYEPSEMGYEQQIRDRLYRLTGDERYRRPEELLDREQ